METHCFAGVDFFLLCIFSSSPNVLYLREIVKSIKETLQFFEDSIILESLCSLQIFHAIPSSTFSEHKRRAVGEKTV